MRPTERPIRCLFRSDDPAHDLGELPLIQDHKPNGVADTAIQAIKWPNHSRYLDRLAPVGKPRTDAALSIDIPISLLPRWKITSDDAASHEG
jgi:hypothetical protein